MAKKRKAPDHTGSQNGQNSSKYDSRLRIDTFEDVADSEDEFHLSRDKVLLEELPAAKRQRRFQEHDDALEPSDDEVLAISPSISEGEDEDEDEDEVEHEHEEHESGEEYDDDFTLRPGKHSSKAYVDDDVSEAESRTPEEEISESWGPSKKDYYNADVIETEQDALEEEAEALRLQQKHLQNMSEADYGFDEADWADEELEVSKGEYGHNSNIVTERLPQMQISEDLSDIERLKLLKSRYPEFESLSKDLLDLQEVHKKLSTELAMQNDEDRSIAKGYNQHHERLADTPFNFLQLQHHALSLYLAALSLYFALLTSTAADEGSAAPLALSATELRNHEMMENLVYTRNLWAKVKDLKAPDVPAEHTLVEESFLQGIVDNDALADSSSVPIGSKTVAINPRKSETQAKKSKRLAKDERTRAEAAARRAERLRRTEDDLAALDELTSKFVSKSRKPLDKQPLRVEQDSDLGEEDQLTSKDLEEKARKRKSLRFYTSQIAQKSNKREAAGRDAGGDIDVPYRERLRDRQARLNAEAERRGKRTSGDPATTLGGDSDEEDRRQARKIRGEDGDAEDYYDMVASRSKQRKDEKRDRAQAFALAAKEGGRVVEREGEMGKDGLKRGITYAIEKNKGLTPHRKKDVRNPRVKKRKKFDEKKKKLGSIKQVYKGGEGKGGYKGELTGIKKGLIKSVKL
ncbi:MAG: hypothetical protein M1820_000653 [Bogoriella megaspora]|nr:MAG: hypothetical protein M1820_000653 [Bogoriella megaspora]